MGAFRPLLGLMLAIAVGLAVYAIAQRVMRQRQPPVATTVEGFWGWLLLLAIGQWLAVLYLLSEILRRLPLYQRAWETSGQRAEALGEIVGRLVILAFVTAAAVLMTRKSRLYPRLLRIELVGMVVLPALGGLWLIEESGTYVTEPKLWLAVTVRFVATAAVAAAWYVYSQHSLRMRNTFVR
jgi:hypothetical protein